MAHIPLFEGQGSSSLYSVKTAATVRRDAKSSPATELLLAACYATLLEEISSLSLDEQKALNFEICFPEDLLFLPSRYHTHPIIEGVTLCLFQLLRYIAHVESLPVTFESFVGEITDVAGFCSGILPATVVACSGTQHELITFGVQAYRLAFWIGYRCSKHADSVIPGRFRDAPWALVVFGLDRDTISQKLKEFSCQSAEVQLHLAAYSSDICVTISGPGPDLVRFKEVQLPDPINSRFAHSHALYHGGEELQHVYLELLDDIHRRKIVFPSFSALKYPLRSTVDGKSIQQGYLDSGDSHDTTLVATVVGMIVLHPVDWQAVWKGLISDATRRHEEDPRSTTQLLSFGPSSGSTLFGHPSRRQTSGLEYVDLSKPTDTPHPTPPSNDSDIAIVGMSFDFPQGENASALWKTLNEGVNAVKEIPASRFDVSQYLDSQSNVTKSGRKLTSRYGNFLDDAWSFDNGFFHVSPREAKSMDPQQRVVLQNAHTALENAGYVADSSPTFQKKSFGCFVGVATGDYVDSLRDDIDVYYSPGTLRAFLSGRISYEFNFSGPSIVIDTACSGSTVAIHQACRALRDGDCTAALAGGVNVICGPDMYLGLGRAHFLSPTGQCKAFDRSADGYCRAEGCGMFVLKRFADAVSENDNILGVIKGVELNQSGNASSITHPDSDTQQQLYNRLLEKANINPHQVTCIEAHGTGTQAGDPTEVRGLRAVFANSRAPDNPLYLTSIKSNIGHAEAASGSAGLAKLLMMMDKKTIPVQAGFKTLNPLIDPLEQDNIIIPRDSQAWTTINGQSRMALLNNFGAAGSNAALLLEEYNPTRGEVCTNRSAYLFAISAKTPEALDKLRWRYLEHVKENLQQLALPDLCYTATARRSILKHRLVFTPASIPDLLEKLSCTNAQSPAPKQKQNSVVFVFSGQGGQYFGMGKELLENVSIFKKVVIACDAILCHLGFPSIIPMLQCKDQDESELGETEMVVASQCAVFVIEYALAMMWISWGVKPDLLLGHSLGEYTALTVAGVMVLEDALHLVAHRAMLMTKLCEPSVSGMIAVNLGTLQMEDILRSDEASFGGLSVACQNSQSDCVVSGPLAQIHALQDQSKQQHFKCTVLKVPFAYHSSWIAPIAEPLTKFASHFKLSEPAIPIGSNLYGRLLKAEDIVPSYFANHAREVVKFDDEIKSLQAQGHLENPLFLEIGPSATTLPMLKTILSSADKVYLPSLQRKKQPWTSICESLGAMYLHGVPVYWRRIFDDSNSKVIGLPNYPFAKTEFRIPYREKSSAAKEEGKEILEDPLTKTNFDLLQIALPMPSPEELPIYETNLSTLSTLIDGHVVGGVSLCPASVYYELALEAAQEAKSLPPDESYRLDNMVYHNPLVHTSTTEERVVRVFLSRNHPSSMINSFQIFSYKTDIQDSLLHCSGSIRAQSISELKDKLARRSAMCEKRGSQLLGNDISGLDTFHTRTIYETIFPRVVSYSKGYQSIHSISVLKSGTEGYGTFQIHDELIVERCMVQPVFVDTILHAAGFLVNSSVDLSEAYVCGKVESVKVLYKDINYAEVFGVYCTTLSWVDGTIFADAYALGAKGNVVAAVKGMHFRRLRLATLKTHLDTLTKKTTHSFSSSEPSDSEPSLSLTSRSSSSSASESPAPHSKDVGIVISQVISDACGTSSENIDTNRDLEELGVDSLMLIEIADSLKSQFSDLPLQTSEMATCSTRKNFEDLINAKVESRHPHMEGSSGHINTPETRSSDSETHRSRARLQKGKVKQVLQSVTGASQSRMEPSTSLESLGLDSLMCIEFLEVLRTEHQITISDEELHACETVSDLEQFDMDRSNQEKAPDRENDTTTLQRALNMTSNPLTVQEGYPSAKPLILVHDGSGLCNMYSKLGSLERTVHGFFNPAFFTSQQWAQDLSQMASHYASLIDMPMSNPIILGGWSFGGVVAFEMARQLQGAGKRIAGVILIDSPCPIDHEPLPKQIIDYVTRSAVRPNSKNNEVGKLVSASFQTNTALIAAYKPRPSATDVKLIMLRSKEGFDSETACGVRHRWLNDRSKQADATKDWEKLTGQKIKVLDIRGNHFEPFAKQNVVDVSDKLKEACRLLDN